MRSKPLISLNLKLNRKKFVLTRVYCQITQVRDLFVKLMQVSYVLFSQTIGLYVRSNGMALQLGFHMMR